VITAVVAFGAFVLGVLLGYAVGTQQLPDYDYEDTSDI
jgi:hypothetical protein